MGILLALVVVAIVSFAVMYERSFSNTPLLKAELRIWRNWPKATLRLYTEKNEIDTKPEKIEISVDPSAEVVLLTVGTGRFFDTSNPHPVIVTVPSEEIRKRWHEKFAEAQGIIQERRKKAEKARKEDLLPKPDKIPTIRPIKKDC